MIIKPAGLPQLRDQMAAHATSDTSLMFRAQHIVDGKAPQLEGKTREQSAKMAAIAEQQALHGADLFYVDAAMVEVAEAAAESLPAFQLDWEDIPSRQGLVYFAKPVTVLDDERSEVLIAAVSWYGWDGVLILNYYADRDTYLPRGFESERKSWPAAFFYVSNVTTFPESPRGSEPVYRTAGGRPDMTATEANEINRMPHLIAVVATAWLLMFQPLAQIKDVKVSRPAPGQVNRTGRRPPRVKDQVRVIRLRRQPTPGTGQSDREYHHQWVVRGHWRQQWYPARQVHRPVWIAPHIKGPEGARMLGGEKVYHWRR